MDRNRVNNGRISKNKRCSPCMCCLKKRIETCKITTLVDKSQVIMNNNIMDNTTNNSSDNTCNHVYKHHEINDN
uniref:Uncharacterized protein n=1 Tax=viral metagenome TaxID=1070528 RepID=A0A6C0AY51_9ZZZZ